jgi:hypothetical protein
MCCIKAVGLHASCCGCSIAVGVVVTALIAAAIATVTAFAAVTPFAAALALTFSAWLALSVAANVLQSTFLALWCLTLVHGRSHGRLVRQCEILLYRVAGRAIGAFTAFSAIPAITTATTTAAFATALRTALAGALAFRALGTLGARFVVATIVAGFARRMLLARCRFTALSMAFTALAIAAFRAFPTLSTALVRTTFAPSLARLA